MTDSQDLNDVDAAILKQLRATYARVDPPPADLDMRVQFAIELENIDIEVARLSEDLIVGSGARGTERMRTITFDSESVTIMISIIERDGQVRIDGWLAPGGGRRVELRMAGTSATTRGASRTVTTEETGRFVFDGVDHGLAQLVVHPRADTGVDSATAVVTPPLML